MTFLNFFYYFLGMLHPGLGRNDTYNENFFSLSQPGLVRDEARMMYFNFLNFFGNNLFRVG